MVLHIYHRKKNLTVSLARYSTGLVVWLGLYYFLIFPRVLNRHPEVGETTHFILSVLLTLIFAAWAFRFVRIILHCIMAYRRAPTIAYTLSDDGISNLRHAEHISWVDVKSAASMFDNNGFQVYRTSGPSFSIFSWGIAPNEIRRAKDFILKKLPEDKTKKLSWF